MSLKKDLTKVFGANFIQLIIGIVNGFFVPAFLGLDQYAYLKTYRLYVSYVGVLHFGFIDGIYLKYGGKKKEDINKESLKLEHDFLLLFQISVSIIALMLGSLFKNFILIAFALSIVPTNLQTFFSFLYQALGEFGLYARIKVFYPILLLIFNLFLIFIIKSNNYIFFVIAQLTALYFVYFFLEIQYKKLVGNTSRLDDKKELITLFKTGIFVMMGNLSSMLFYSMDRWFVKFLMPLESFAYYSFAISMMGVINVMVSSITTTFYPYFSKGYKDNQLKKIKEYFLIIGSFASLGYFVLSFIVKAFLKKYIPSLNIISILFASFPAIIVINAIYVNLYKTTKQGRKYFGTVLLMALISFFLNLLAVFIRKSTLSIALATTIAFYVWFLYSSKHFKGLEIGFKETLYLVLYLILFLSSSIYLSAYNGFLVFFTGLIILVLCFYRREFVELIKRTVKK